jgi:murein DD-endopeptidase MepM/ murein hydrolase activator NlpD
MKKIFLILFLMAISLAVFIFSWKNKDHGANLEIETDQLISEDASVQNETDDSEQDISIDSDFQAPLAGAEERINKKPFGIFITPQNSPVQPERFSGYHTGTDFEIFPEETDRDVPVFAVCAGRILAKKVAMGYGGVLVLSCPLDDQPTTIIYGHLDLKSVEKEVGDDVKTGEELGLLGAGYSQETYGERKHLHFGIHKGAEINLTGYVKTKKGLENWLNPCDYFCK